MLSGDIVGGAFTKSSKASRCILLLTPLSTRRRHRAALGYCETSSPGCTTEQKPAQARRSSGARGVLFGTRQAPRRPRLLRGLHLPINLAGDSGAGLCLPQEPQATVRESLRSCRSSAAIPLPGHQAAQGFPEVHICPQSHSSRRMHWLPSGPWHSCPASAEMLRSVVRTGPRRSSCSQENESQKAGTLGPQQICPDRRSTKWPHDRVAGGPCIAPGSGPGQGFASALGGPLCPVSPRLMPGVGAGPGWAPGRLYLELGSRAQERGCAGFR